MLYCAAEFSEIIALAFVSGIE